jgi:hypothetical protein
MYDQNARKSAEMQHFIAYVSKVKKENLGLRFLSKLKGKRIISLETIIKTLKEDKENYSLKVDFDKFADSLLHQKSMEEYGRFYWTDVRNRINEGLDNSAPLKLGKLMAITFESAKSLSHQMGLNLSNLKVKFLHVETKYKQAMQQLNLLKNEVDLRKANNAVELLARIVQQELDSYKRVLQLSSMQTPSKILLNFRYWAGFEKVQMPEQANEAIMESMDEAARARLLHKVINNSQVLKQLVVFIKYNQSNLQRIPSPEPAKKKAQLPKFNRLPFVDKERLCRSVDEDPKAEKVSPFLTDRTGDESNRLIEDEISQVHKIQKSPKPMKKMRLAKDMLSNLNKSLQSSTLRNDLRLLLEEKKDQSTDKNRLPASNPGRKVPKRLGMFTMRIK